MDENQLSEKSQAEEKANLSEGDDVRIESAPIEQLKDPQKEDQSDKYAQLDTNCKTPNDNKRNADVSSPR